MKIYFGSFAYFLYLFLVAGLIAAVYFLFRKKSEVIKKTVVLFLMGLNILQHLFKWAVWPHLAGTGFNHTNTAYNQCALLILISPIILLSKSKAWKDYLVYFGVGGPLLAMIVPHWFEDQYAFSSEAIRFYFCHGMLVATSLLIVLFRLHSIDYKNSPKIAPLFFLSLIFVMFNDFACYSAGLLGDRTQNLYDVLNASNPCWIMHPAPPAGFEWVTAALEAFTPNVFLGNPDGTGYTPLLWYVIPMYLLCTILAYLFGCLIDRKHFMKDFHAFCARPQIASILAKIRKKSDTQPPESKQDEEQPQDEDNKK